MASLLEQLVRSENWPPERLQASQLRQARTVLAHALIHSPLHRGRLALSPADALGIDWPAWHTLPTLPRSVLQQQLEDVLAREIPDAHGALAWHTTTGSTGHPLRIAVTQFCDFVYGALTLREHRWHRRDPGARLFVARSGAREGDFPDWGTPVAELYATGPLRVIDVKHSVQCTSSCSGSRSSTRTIC